MTQKERETCTRILGFLDAVSKVESNIFSGGAEHAKRMMQEILKEEEKPDADGPQTLREAMQKARGNGSTRIKGRRLPGAMQEMPGTEEGGARWMNGRRS